MSFDVSPIREGSLSVDGENQFYKKVQSELLKIVIAEHDFNPQELSKGELLRLSSHVENIESDKYIELHNIDAKLLLTTKLGLLADILKYASSMNPESTVSITFTD
ncbi:hypothetical protein M3919_003883 [Vibrio parahaemolyticus]|uniref:hypothetical protein n=1 Tax=Vibrio parahaemolyticus TaxID=670 RepID=UPI0038737D65|nr:hypothetical protein [Vibrio parahaemolyticus]EJE4158648.1 hypothetical protein [Vibrio parahaemolyticus]